MVDLFDLGINVPVAKERFLGNEELYKKFLFQFPFNLSMKQGLEYTEKGDFPNALNAFYKFKSVAGDLSIYKVHEILGEITDELRLGKGLSEKKKERLLTEYNKICDVIRKLEKEKVKLF